MATAILSPPEPSTATSIWTPYQMTAEAYFKAIEAGVFPQEDRIELWEGQIYEKMGKNNPHAVASGKIWKVFGKILPEGWAFWPENPILVNDRTAPLPDGAVVRGEPDDYVGRPNPSTNDIALVVELADTSLRRNRTQTLEVYGRSGLSCYWIVNIPERSVEVYSQPHSIDGVGGYASCEIFKPGASVPLVLDNREIAQIPVDDLLPKEEAR